MRQRRDSRRYTVKQLADLSGVSVRTLHYYDETGLLRPMGIGGNGYRYYGREQLLRLQHILFFRKLRFSLRDVKRVLAGDRRDRIAALRAQRRRLVAEAEQYEALLATVDRCLDELEGKRTMKDEELFYGLNSKKQKEHEAWLVDRYGPEMKKTVDGTRRRMRGWTPEQWAEQGAEAAAINAGLCAARKRGAGAGDAEVQALVGRHYRWVCRFWTPNRESYIGLSQLYAEHPDFRRFFDGPGREGLLEFLAQAMRLYAERELTSEVPP